MGIFDRFKKNPNEGTKDASRADVRGSKGSNFSGPDAAYQPAPGEVAQSREFDPGATFHGSEAVMNVKSSGRFEITGGDVNRENPYFWKGVVDALNNESNFDPNNRDLSLAVKAAMETATLTKMKAEGKLGFEAIDISVTVVQIEQALSRAAA